MRESLCYTLKPHQIIVDLGHPEIFHLTILELFLFFPDLTYICMIRFHLRSCHFSYDGSLIILATQRGSLSSLHSTLAIRV